MSEEVFAALLEESALREWEKYENAADPVISLKHKRAMKRIFTMYEKNTASLRETEPTQIKTRIKLTRKTVVMIFAIIFMAAIAGCTVAYFITNGFRGNVYDKYTKIFSLNVEDCAQNIEEIYCIADLPEGFELIKTETTSIMHYMLYENAETAQTVMLRQNSKKNFSPQYDNEHGNFTEIEINDSKGLYIDWSNDEWDSGSVIWDNGRYIFEITGNLNKNYLLFLAKNTKVFEN